MYFSFNTTMLPHISFMNKCVTGKDWMHPKRTPKEFILFIVISGEMYLQEDEERYELKRGDYIFLQPERTHFGYAASGCVYYYIHFPGDCLSGWDCKDILQITRIIMENNKVAYRCDPFGDELYREYKLFIPKNRHIYDEATLKQIGIYMDEAASLEKKQTPHYKLNCSSRFIEILILLSKDFVMNLLPGEQNKSHHEKLHDLINFIQIKYPEHISGKEIAEQFNRNFDSLNRFFKKETGLTIFQYLKQVRLNRARELLTTTQLKLEEISEQTGFCDQYYFSRAFKQEFGISPKKYAGNRRDVV